MPFVGLTGGMGAGKSTALAALARLGAEVLSSDAVVHELYEGEQLRDAVVARFGARRWRQAAWWIARRWPGARSPAAEDRAWLEGLVWPLVGARVGEWLEQARARRPRRAAAVVEVPLLFEAGMEELYDATIAVVSEEAVRRERAAARGHALVDERAARQLSQEEKARAGDVRGAQRRQRATICERELSAVLDKLER